MVDLGVPRIFLFLAQALYLGHMCGACKVAELTLRIRATRGRSTERQRDRESRPNPMKDPRDSREALRPDEFSRFAGGFHGVAKRVSFGVALGADFEGFWKPKWSPRASKIIVF